MENYIVYIAKKAGLFGVLDSSTTKIAKDLKVSQQTVSRKLAELEASNLIKKTSTPKGVSISLKDKGRTLLTDHFNSLKSIFSEKKELEGKVTKGIGEGSYYVAKNQYQKQFSKKLGFKAYPGTLNITVKPEEALHFIAGLKSLNIGGFTTKTRTYGRIKCYKIKIRSTDAAIVVPERSRYGEDILEIIAPANLRENFKLSDNNIIKITY